MAVEEFTVKGRPFASRLVASCSSSMSYKVEIDLSSSAICANIISSCMSGFQAQHTIGKSTLVGPN